MEVGDDRFSLMAFSKDLGPPTFLCGILNTKGQTTMKLPVVVLPGEWYVGFKAAYEEGAYA